MSERDDYPILASVLRGVSIPYTPPECVACVVCPRHGNTTGPWPPHGPATPFPGFATHG